MTRANLDSDHGSGAAAEPSPLCSASHSSAPPFGADTCPYEVFRWSRMQGEFVPLAVLARFKAIAERRMAPLPPGAVQRPPCDLCLLAYPSGADLKELTLPRAR